jgi:hypothetical protein
LQRRFDVLTRASEAGGVRVGKFNACKVTYYGRTFDSKLEGVRALQLWDRQRRGEISDLCFQVPLVIPNVCKAVIDFTYMENGEQVYEDAKGYRTRVWVIKKKLIKEVLGIDVREFPPRVRKPRTRSLAK